MFIPTKNWVFLVQNVRSFLVYIDAIVIIILFFYFIIILELSICYTKEKEKKKPSLKIKMLIYKMFPWVLDTDFTSFIA